MSDGKSGRVTVSPEVMERRLQETLRGRCFTLENQCKSLSNELGEKYSLQNKSNMNSSQLQSYLNQLEHDNRRLSVAVEVMEWTNKCEVLTAQIRALTGFLEIDDPFLVALTGKTVSQLKHTFDKQQKTIIDLQGKKHQKLRLIIERKIHDVTANFDIEDTVHISSQTITSKPADIERKAFDLDQHKELAIDRLDEIVDTDFVAEYTKRIGAVENQAEYLSWLTEVSRRIEQERLLAIYRKAKAELLRKLPLLPDGPNKNTLRIEIDKLAEPLHWGADYKDWDRKLRERKDTIATYIEKELEENTKYQYLVDCLNEVLLEQDISSSSNLETEGGAISIIGKFENYENYGLSILIDQESGEIRYEPTLLNGQPESSTDLAAFEKMMCPHVYSLADELEKRFGITNEFTIETPPIIEVSTGVSQKTQQQLKREAEERQQFYINNQQQRLQQMQRSIH